MLNYLILFVAIALSSVAGYYSIIGLTSIFSGAFIPILIMGSILETAKVATTAWLHSNWKDCPKFIKAYLCFAVVLLMFITSMGIFGFLSKAHIQESATSTVSTDKIEFINQQIDIEKQKITDDKTELNQLDKTVSNLLDANRVRGSAGSIAIRKSQTGERESLLKDIADANNKINSLTEQRLKLNQDQRKIEVEFGPLKYITELIYGESNQELLERSVRYVIILLILVFDPLALLLLIASGIGLQNNSFTFIKNRGIVNIDGEDF